MSEDEIDIGQINSLRAHLKKLHTTTEYLQKYCRWNYYRPHPDTQLLFHNSHAKERSIVLGSQQGKSTATGFEMAFAACDYWPAWHTGLHPAPPNIVRSAKFIGWFCSISSQSVRDGIQAKLLGDISQKDGLGTGAIPLDLIRGVTMSRGISNFVDTVTVARETGGIGLLQSKTYEQDPKAYQAVPVDAVLIDEDPGYSDLIYNECLARTISTNGRIIVSLTPMLGLTPIRKRFLAGGAGMFEVRGGLNQALHIPADRRQAIIDSVPERERAARIYGQEQQGEGAVFDIDPRDVAFKYDPNNPPCDFSKFLWGIDFSHGGTSSQAHPFAAVLAMYNQFKDVIWIVDAFKMFRQLPAQHAERIKADAWHWYAPICWPHDGQQSADASTQTTYSQIYKQLGLNLLPTWATFRDGGYGFEAGITDMRNRFASGRLKVARHLADFFTELQNLHYKDGKVVKEDDDLLSATRQVVMQIRSARALEDAEKWKHAQGAKRRQGNRPRLAQGVDTEPLWGCD